MASLISYVNHVDDDATILTASDTAGDLSVSNLADTIIGNRWRTTSLGAFVDVDFGSNKSVDIVALRFPRDTTFPTSGTVRHQFDADGGTPGSGAADDSTAIAIDTTAGYGYHAYKPASTVTARYWRFTFAVTGVSFIDVGRAWAGEILEPSIGVSFGYRDDWLDLSRVSSARRSGAQYADEMARVRLLSIPYNAIEAADRTTFREMERVVGISKQVLFMLDSATPTTESIIGRLAETAPVRRSHQTVAALYSLSFRIIESN